MKISTVLLLCACLLLLAAPALEAAKDKGPKSDPKSKPEPKTKPEPKVKPEAKKPEPEPKVKSKDKDPAPKPKSEPKKPARKMKQEPKEPPKCKGSAKYTIVNDCKWAKDTHPKDYPKGAGFSPLCGTAHSDGFFMWRENAQATNGVKNIAELGDCDQFLNEVLFCKSQENCREPLSFDCSKASGTCKHEGSMTLTPKLHMASFLAMVTPSPDWAVGVDAIDFCNKGEWIKSLKLDLHAIDIGTDAGTTFLSEDIGEGLFRPMAILDNADKSNIFYNKKEGKLYPLCQIKFKLL